MEHGNGDSYDWATERRVEGSVNKHMADIALETLQQRLTAMSDEMQSLAEHVSRRSGEDLKNEPRRGDVSLGLEPPLSSTYGSGAADKFNSACSTGSEPCHSRSRGACIWFPVVLMVKKNSGSDQPVNLPDCRQVNL